MVKEKAVSATAEATSVGSFAAYLNLTKPRIMLLVLFTGAAALVVEGSFLTQPVNFFLVLFGLYLTGGAANALNQYFERDIDARMTRTSSRRPLPTGQVTPFQALFFSIVIGAVGVVLFAVVFNMLTASLALITILFYSLYYTLWLKPTTTQNIVIGGAAGAMAPVGAWAAATGEMHIAAWLMFGIIFLWTPPHFWSLALLCKDDYDRVGLPMMPNIKGEKATLQQIFWYTIVLVIASLTLVLIQTGWIYLAAAVLLGIGYVRLAAKSLHDSSRQNIRKLFGYSLLYLFGIFSSIIIDAIVPLSLRL
jgi:protoheme IX farnesyltransferase